MEQYRHTQIGYVILFSLGAAALFLLYMLMVNGFHWVALLVLLTLGIAAWLSGSMTVSVDEDCLTVGWGLGAMRKRIRVDEIETWRVVKNPWYYGWGIKIIPRGWLFNVSGFWAVELNMKNGRCYRCGTDEPQELVKALTTVGVRQE